MVTIHLERTINAAPERVFDWLADPAGLTSAPLVFTSVFVDGATAPTVGAVRKVTGLGISFREEYTAVDAPRSYSYLILSSFPPFDHEGGTLTFTPAGDGTHVDWLTEYSHPPRFGGKVLQKISKPLLEASFSAILSGCAKALKR